MTRTAPSDTRRPAFTLVELLVVVGVIALLIGILVPTLGSVRERSRAMACGARLKSIGTGAQLHLTDNRDRLPQMQIDDQGNWVRAEGTTGSTMGPLFGGKIGLLPFQGINRYGASSRPLNRYLDVRNAPTDPAVSGMDSPEDVRKLSAAFQIDVFESPVDRGFGVPPEALFLAPQDRDAVTSAYNTFGTSYILNDHAIGGVQASSPDDKGPISDDPTAAPERPTLVPCRGGPIPKIKSPNLTWLAASYTIYNYDRGSNLRMNWYDRDRVEANLLFADMHLGTTLPVASPTDFELMRRFEGGPMWDPGQSTPAEGAATNVTVNYSFLPQPEWFLSPDSAECE